MPQTTQSASQETSPTSYGYCSWHQGQARGVRLIQATEQGSGPGSAGNHFACLPCRQAYDLVPLADRM
ncbi:hypothetical protein [Streptomyces sp. NBC_00557]|uniref:hypothetical protein n=1 Tax=Streptomyces sp. NBC_00557 TaxID=2975776 RepID=UPI002E812C0E|nr:hypothetical protein [Streptomyces sp. NBC_00557]WUC36424.1 hypothetical protein OG956_20445 [Streptomyces sp. NBC_00557]